MNLKIKNTIIPQFSLFYSRLPNGNITAYIYLMSKVIDGQDIPVFLMLETTDINRTEPFDIKSQIAVVGRGWDNLKINLNQQLSYKEFDEIAYIDLPLFNNGSIVKYNRKQRMIFNVYKKVIDKNLYRPLLIDLNSIVDDLENTEFKYMSSLNTYHVNPKHFKILYSSAENSNIELVRDFIPIKRKPTVSIAEFDNVSDVLDYNEFVDKFVITKDDEDIPPKISNLLRDLVAKTYQLGRDELIIEYDTEITETKTPFDTKEYGEPAIFSRGQLFYPILGEYSDCALDLAFRGDDNKIYDKRQVFMGIKREDIEKYKKYFDYSPTYGKKPKRKKKKAPEPTPEPPIKTPTGINIIQTGNVSLLTRINTWNYSKYPSIKITDEHYYPCVGLRDSKELVFCFFSPREEKIYAVDKIYKAMPNAQNVNQYLKINLKKDIEDELEKFRYPTQINNVQIPSLNANQYKDYFAILSFAKFNEIEVSQFKFWVHFCRNIQTNRFEIMFALRSEPYFNTNQFNSFLLAHERAGLMSILNLDIYDVTQVRQLCDAKFYEDTADCIKIPQLKPEFEAIDTGSNAWFTCYDTQKDAIAFYSLNHRLIYTAKDFIDTEIYRSLDTLQQKKIKILAKIDITNIDSIQNLGANAPYSISKYFTDLRRFSKTLKLENDPTIYMPILARNNETGFMNVGFIPTESGDETKIIGGREFISEMKQGQTIDGSLLAESYFTGLMDEIDSSGAEQKTISLMRTNQSNTFPLSIINTELEFIEALRLIYPIQEEFLNIQLENGMQFSPVLAREKGTYNYEIAYKKYENPYQIVFTKEMVLSQASPNDEKKYKALFQATPYDYESMLKIFKPDGKKIELFSEQVLFDDNTKSTFLPLKIDDEFVIMEIIENKEYDINVLLKDPDRFSDETIEMLEYWQKRYAQSSQVSTQQDLELLALINDLDSSYQEIPLTIDQYGKTSYSIEYMLVVARDKNTNKEVLAVMPNDYRNDDAILSFGTLLENINPDLIDINGNNMLTALAGINFKNMQHPDNLREFKFIRNSTNREIFNRNIDVEPYADINDYYFLYEKYKYLDDVYREYTPIFARFSGTSDYTIAFRNIKDRNNVYFGSDFMNAKDQDAVDLVDSLIISKPFSFTNEIVDDFEKLAKPCPVETDIIKIDGNLYKIVLTPTNFIALWDILKGNIYTKAQLPIIGSPALREELIKDMELVEQEISAKGLNVATPKTTKNPKPKTLKYLLNDLISDFREIPRNLSPQGKKSSGMYYYMPVIAEGKGKEMLAFIPFNSRSNDDLISKEDFLKDMPDMVTSSNIQMKKALQNIDTTSTKTLMDTAKVMRYEQAKDFPIINENINYRDMETLSSFAKATFGRLDDKYYEITTSRRTYEPVLAEYLNSAVVDIAFKSTNPDDDYVLFTSNQVKNELDNAGKMVYDDLFKADLLNVSTLNEITVSPQLEPINGAKIIVDDVNKRMFLPVLKTRTQKVALLVPKESDLFTKEEIENSSEPETLKKELIEQIDKYQATFNKKKSVPLQKPQSSKPVVEPKTEEEELDDLLGSLLD